MKNLTIFCCAILFLGLSMGLQAQDASPETPDMEADRSVEFKSSKQKPEMETLLKNGTSFGGFGAFSVKIADLNGQAGVFTGGQLATVLNHSLNIGLAGYALATDVNANYLDLEGNDYYFELGYGGLLIEPVIRSNKLVHLTVPIIIGAGWAGVSDRRFYQPGFHFDRDIEEEDVFWVIEPSVNLEVNIWKIMRIDFGVGYRYFGDANFTNTTDADMSGVSGNITFKFGWF